MTVRNAYAGTAALFRFAARRDRLRGTIWVVVMTALVGLSAASITALYDSPEKLREYAVLASADDTFKAVAGPGFGLEAPTMGAVMMNEVSAYAFIGTALMVTFVLTRHTRTEEGTDRAELVRAAPVGRLAPLLAAGVWAATLTAALSIALCVTLLSFGLAAAGTVAFGLSVFGVGVLFAGVAAVAAQVGSTGRLASALAGLVLGAMFVVRAVGDMGVPLLSWVSPLGWAWQIRAFAGERWWVVVLSLGTGASMFTLALQVASTRDLGAGLLPQRPGRPVARPSLASPLAMAARLLRPSIVGWTTGVALLAGFMGSIADLADDFLENEEFAEFFPAEALATPAESFLTTSLLMVGLLGSGFTVSAVLRLRSEERDGRAEPTLALSVSRRRWLLSFATVAALGSATIMVVAGAVAGFAYGLQVGDLGEVVRLAAAALVWVPAQVLLGGLALALVGAKPRSAPAAWAGLGIALVVGLLAETLGLAQGLRNVSPFEHVPALPAESFRLAPTLGLLAVTAVLAAIGSAGFQRRDLDAG